MPFKNVPMSKENISMLVHNKQILIKFCIGQGNSTAEKYFVNKKTGHVGRGCLDLDKLWSVSLMQALCPPLSPTRIATLEKRRIRNCESITL
jgi:hypothetical protein